MASFEVDKKVQRNIFMPAPLRSSRVDKGSANSKNYEALLSGSGLGNTSATNKTNADQFSALLQQQAENSRVRTVVVNTVESIDASVIKQTSKSLNDNRDPQERNSFISRNESNDSTQRSAEKFHNDREFHNDRDRAHYAERNVDRNDGDYNNQRSAFRDDYSSDSTATNNHDTVAGRENQYAQTQKHQQRSSTDKDNGADDDAVSGNEGKNDASSQADDNNGGVKNSHSKNTESAASNHRDNESAVNEVDQNSVANNGNDIQSQDSVTKVVEDISLVTTTPNATTDQSQQDANNLGLSGLLNSGVSLPVLQWLLVQLDNDATANIANNTNKSGDLFTGKTANANNNSATTENTAGLSSSLGADQKIDAHDWSRILAALLKNSEASSGVSNNASASSGSSSGDASGADKQASVNVIVSSTVSPVESQGNNATTASDIKQVWQALLQQLSRAGIIDEGIQSDPSLVNNNQNLTSSSQNTAAVVQQNQSTTDTAAIRSILQQLIGQLSNDTQQSSQNPLQKIDVNSTSNASQNNGISVHSASEENLTVIQQLIQNDNSTSVATDNTDSQKTDFIAPVALLSQARAYAQDNEMANIFRSLQGTQKGDGGTLKSANATISAVFGTQQNKNTQNNATNGNANQNSKGSQGLLAQSLTSGSNGNSTQGAKVLADFASSLSNDNTTADSLWGRSLNVRGGDVSSNSPQDSFLNATSRLDNPISKKAGNTTAKSALRQGGASEQVFFSIRRNLSQGPGKSEIRVELQPQELGKVRLNLSLDAMNRATVRISSEREDTDRLLRSDAKSLLDALRNSGLDLEEQDLNFNLQEHNTHSDDKKSNSNKNNSAMELSEEDVIAVDSIKSVSVDDLDALVSANTTDQESDEESVSALDVNAYDSIDVTV